MASSTSPSASRRTCDPFGWATTVSTQTVVRPDASVEMLTSSTRSIGPRSRNLRSSSTTSEPSLLVSAIANTSGSIANSVGDSLLSGLPGTSPFPLSYFLSRSRAGRAADSPGTSSTTGGKMAERARRSAEPSTESASDGAP